MRLPSLLKRRVAGWVDGIFDVYATKSYSQEGEDLILRRMFERRPRGFYVDVGAYHPRRFSNTNLFYKRGWNGINIDPSPDAIRAFRSARPRDVNLEIGVSDHSQILKYHVFDEPALTSFDGNLVAWRLANTRCRLLKTIDVPVEPLREILQKYLPANQTIDFMSVDAEGLDLAVLKSNDWRVFRPQCVVAEALRSSLEEAMHGEVYLFMKEKGYELFARTYNTLIFRDALCNGKT